MCFPPGDIAAGAELPVLLLSWHGTLVCLPRDGGGLAQAALGEAAPLKLELPAGCPDAPLQVRTSLGLLQVQPAQGRRGIWISRFGQFLCADGNTPVVTFDRAAASLWETFLPVTAEDVADLVCLMRQRWILADSRRVLARRAVRLGPGFRLQVGNAEVDLVARLPLGPRDGAGMAYRAPEVFRLGELELVMASPRGSALVAAPAWPTRPRQNAQAMVLAVHRELRGSEPEPGELERDVAFLLERGGAEGLGDLLDVHRNDGAGLAPANRAGPSAGPAEPEAAACPVVSLGIGCATTRVLQRVRVVDAQCGGGAQGEDEPGGSVPGEGAQRVGVQVTGAQRLPMPFDWINCTPAMVRDCLETDFAVLLDRSCYRSLTGQPQPNEPWNACEHTTYAERYGLRRVFNHLDPTQEAAYRYVQAGVDRFRDLLAADGPKLFVQIRHAVRDRQAGHVGQVDQTGQADQTRQAGGTRQAGEVRPAGEVRRARDVAEDDFVATAALLDRLTQGAMLLQVSVQPPDGRLAVPLLSRTASQGAHRLYRLQPTGPMDGGGFQLQVDQDYVAWVVGVHAARPAVAARTNPPGGAARVIEAFEMFEASRPGAGDAGLAAGETVADAGNRALGAASRVAGLPHAYRFALYDARSAGVNAETLQVEMRPEQVTLCLDGSGRDPWRLMQRAMAMMLVIEAMREQGWVGDARFLAEPSDEGVRDDAASFCSSRPGALLLPDCDFVGTGGYDEQRRLVAARAPAWADRRRVVFWRGLTTGRLRRAPPPPGEADDFTWLARLEMVHRARRSPHAGFYDVGIAGVVQIDDSAGMRARLEQADLFRPHAPRTAFLECRAVLVIDGNTNAWSALFCALLGGSCVLRVESEGGFRQWYYDRLKPWIHFVPVRADLSDLDDVVAWVMSHDDDARAIGAAGRALAEAMNLAAEIELAAGRLRDWLG